MRRFYPISNVYCFAIALLRPESWGPPIEDIVVSFCAPDVI